MKIGKLDMEPKLVADGMCMTSFFTGACIAASVCATKKHQSYDDKIAEEVALNSAIASVLCVTLAESGNLDFMGKHSGAIAKIGSRLSDEQINVGTMAVLKLLTGGVH